MHHFLVGKKQISLCRNFHSNAEVGVISDVGIESVEYGIIRNVLLVLCPVHFVMHNNKIHKIQNERVLCEQCYEVTAQQSVAAKNVSVNAAPGGVHPTQEPGKLGIY